MQRNFFLYLTTFFCGASIMGVEIASSRFMAPYFGSSMITWTIIIGVILMAMSLGNLLGGRLADRHDPEQKLFQLILASSIWIALIPIVGKYLIATIAAAAVVMFPGDPILVGSLCSCILLFALPCVVLGATSPCMLKAATKNLENNGQIAGEIYGLSTLGSIFGTFLPTFITIPTLGTDKTFFLFAAILCVLAAANAFRNKIGGKKQVGVLLIIATMACTNCSPSFAFWTTPLCETESVYNYLLVKQNDDVTTLSSHVLLGTQSMYTPKIGLTGLYYDMALLAPFFIKPTVGNEKLQVLILGFATGTFAKLMRHFFPGTVVDGVEIDPKIVSLGKKYFALKDADAKVFIEDGRIFLTRTDKKYRVVFLDAFQDVTYPFHMATLEFFQQLAKNLEDDGVLAINVNMRSPFKPDLVTYLTGTLTKVFPQVLICTHPDYYNRIIFAAKKPGLLKNFTDQVKLMQADHPLQKLAEKALPGLEEAPESQLVLTDDLAPLELIGFKMLTEQLKGAFRELLIRVIFQLKDSFA